MGKFTKSNRLCKFIRQHYFVGVLLCRTLIIIILKLITMLLVFITQRTEDGRNMKESDFIKARYRSQNNVL